MNTNIYLFFVVILSIIPQEIFSQSDEKSEAGFTKMRSYTVSIGTVVEDSFVNDKKKALIRKFVSVGSGLVTYVKYKDRTFRTVVTAGHVVKFFAENRQMSVFLRASWADTIKTTDYFGTEVPLFNLDGTQNTFLYQSSEIDLGCILLFPGYIRNDSKLIEMNQINANARNVFPYNQMRTPYLGEQVWVWGYPSHIENNTQNDFLYNISTFKPGYLTWKPSPNMISSDLEHIALIESNATYGNSGGPVFALKSDDIELVGILVGGYNETDTVYVNNRPAVDTVSKQTYITKRRSGVSIIVKAEYVKKLCEFVESKIVDYK